MLGGIYVIKNKHNNKVYVGSTKNFIKREKVHFKLLVQNKHWNLKLQRSFNCHGIDNFKFKIIEVLPYEKEIIIQRENFWIHYFNSKSNGYNIADASFGDCLSNHPNKEEIKIKISIGLKLKFSRLSDLERKEKFGQYGSTNGMFGKKHSDSAKRNISEKNKQYKLINGVGKNYGKKYSEEHKKKISNFAKTRTGEKNAFFGKKHSEEFKQKMSDFAKGRRPANAKILIIDDVEYMTREEAERCTGIKASTLYFRARSSNPKFKNIYFKEE